MIQETPLPPMSPAAQAAADLLAAAEVLERDGWVQHDYVTGDGCHCIAGALVAVLGGRGAPETLAATPGDRRDDRFWRAIGLFNEVVTGGTGEGAVLNWNDDECGTGDQAVAALRTAAAAGEQR